MHAEIKTTQNTQYTGIFLRGNPMLEKTIKHFSLCSSVSMKLQFIIFQFDKNPPVADNEESNPRRQQPIIDNEDTNLLRHQPVVDNEDTNPLMH
jgi:hypothetical protein